MVIKNRTIQLVPEVKGCYGPRVWIEASDQTLNSILTVLSVWPGPTDTKSDVINGILSYWYCYELPLDFMNKNNYVWSNLISRLNITIKED